VKEEEELHSKEETDKTHREVESLVTGSGRF